MAKNGGLITAKDLEGYDMAWREPVRGTYRGYDIISMSPPSSGGTHLLQILNVMENADIGALGFASSETLRITAEAMRYAYADRSEYMGDPDFVKVPVKDLTSKEYAKSIYDKIVAAKGATPSSEVKPGLSPIKEGSNTTHYSVVDKNGNAVSVTYTVNDWYGSGAAVAGAGFLLNNEMDDFAAKAGVPNIYGLVGSDANSIAPGKRPLSSMSPSLVLKDGKLFIVAGSPGGSRIITTTLQVISNVIDHGMNISEAIEAPRVHMQWLPDELRFEKYGLTKDVADKLTALGYKLSEQEPMGDVNGILVDPKTGEIFGSHDPRRLF
jgi:gamma-glutamyltranspeptidase/glutathione hydrolase